MSNLVRKSTRWLRRSGKHPYFLFFINGFLLAFIIYCYVEDQYEVQLFDTLKDLVYKEAGKGASNDEVLFRESLKVAHNIEANRQTFFGDDNELSGVKAGFLQPVTYHLMTGRGACGSYAYVLGRLLMAMDYPVRFAQMNVNGHEARHIIVEAKTQDRWVVLDPQFHQYFTKPDGKLASFGDIQNNWSYYKLQVAPGYITDYRYEKVRYTNWQKIPVLMPAAKKVLDWTIGKQQADTISLRSVVLRKFHFILTVLLTLYAVLIFYKVAKFLRRKYSRRKITLVNSPLILAERKAAS